MSSRSDNSSTAASHAPGWATVTRWRNWRLITKLAAVVLVPTVFAITLGTLQIRGQIADSEEYRQSDQVVQAATALRATIGTLQEERTRTAEYLAQGTVSATTLQQQFDATDRQNDTSRSRLQSHIARDPVVRFNHEQAQRQLDNVRALRGEVLSSTIDPVVAINAYSEASRSLLALDRALMVQIATPTLTGTTNASHALAKLGEELSLQQALILVSVLRDSLTSSSRISLEASEIRRATATDEFRSVAAEDRRTEFDELLSAQNPVARDRSLQLAMGTPGEDTSEGLSPLMVRATVWNDQSESAINGIAELQFRMDSRLHRTAFQLSEGSSNMAGVQSVILLSALLVAGAIITLIARQLLGSLDLLRRAALVTAHRQLPQVISDVRAGNRTRDRIEPVPVHTTEEVGQLARAFDAMQDQAVVLASEQAELRKAYSDSFVNVSRRSQSLLERQLRLFETLERDEEDPDHLATLFQLDHLATRMRRNNENLMVLSGSDMARRFTRSTTPADLVRAAVSEIEHYPRVVVHPMPDVRIVSYACSDLVRLLAELLDNAANFSSPETVVTVTGRRHEDGAMSIDIVDQGFGMGEAELAATNHRIRTDHEVQASTSRRMGLFVVARLRTRHDIQVRLHPGRNGTGVRATTTLRAEMLVAAAEDERTRTNGATVHIERSEPSHDGSAAHNGSEGHDELLNAFDWEAAEQDAATRSGVVRNGFALPSDVAIPGQVREEPSPGRDAVAEHVDDDSAAPRHALFSPSEQESYAPDQRVAEPSGEEWLGGPAETDRTDTDGAITGEEGVQASVDAAEDESLETPIFDDLASAWFQVSRAEPVPHDHSELRWPAKPAAGDSKGTFQSPVTERVPYSQTAPTEGSGDEAPAQWSFAADDDQDRAAQVADREPDEFTEAGLPRRTPLAHLISGSAGTDEGRHRPRNAATTRSRLAGFQHGTEQARHRLEPSEDHPDDVSEPENSAEQTVTDMDLVVEHADGLTSAGLPRRVPQSHLAPEASTEYPDAPPPVRRNAELVRGRLSGFQRGARRGRHSRGDASVETTAEGQS